MTTKNQKPIWLLLIIILTSITACANDKTLKQDTIAAEQVSRQHSELGYKSSDLDKNCKTGAIELVAQQQELSVTGKPRRYFLYGETPRATPIICADPGDTLNITLKNTLDPLDWEAIESLDPDVTRTNDKADQSSQDAMEKKSNITNLHTHGLHVGPRKNRDNVMLKIGKDKQMTYEIPIVSDHAPGTHWYHAHLHGATALQVQGGMAGALIVRSQDYNDLTPPDWRERTHERLLLKQNAMGYKIPSQSNQRQTPLSSRQALEKAVVDKLAKVTDSNNAQRKVALMDDQTLKTMAKELKDLSPRTLFMVNGQINASTTIEAGDIVRMRYINAGSRYADSVELWVKDDLGNSSQLLLAAADGVNLIKLAKYDENNPLKLGPGNRADMYVYFEHEGIYELEDKISGNILWTITVKGGRGSEEEADQFAKDLDDHLAYLQGTAPYNGGYLRQPGDADVYTERTITMNKFPYPESMLSRFGVNNRTFEHGSYLGKEAIDGGSKPDSPSQHWPFVGGTVEKWTISQTGNAQGHPFHIHVSPFWLDDICEIKKENPEEEINCWSDDSEKKRQLNRWMDTLMLNAFPNPNDGSNNGADAERTSWEIAKVRYKVPKTLDLPGQQFEGVFVLHCHILQHEDRGLMINTMIVDESVTDATKTFEQYQEENHKINDCIEAGDHPCGNW